MIGDTALRQPCRSILLRHVVQRLGIILPLLAALLGSAAPAHAQSGASVSGVIVDSAGTPLSGINVRLEKTQRGAVSNRRGRYEIGNIPPGTYTLTASSVGYVPQTRSIHLSAGEAMQANFTLNASMVQSSGVEVIGRSSAQVKRDAPIKIEVVDLRKMQTQSADVAQVLSRSPGTHIRQEGGLGGDATININGLQGKAVRVFKDDVPVDYLGRGFNLSLIPVNSLDRIEVYKGSMPISLGADALGGGINFVSKQVHQNYLDLSYEYGSFNTHRATVNAYYIVDTTLNAFISTNDYYNTSANNYEVDGNLVDTATSQRYAARVPQFHNGAWSYFTEVNGGVENVSWADRLTIGLAYSDFHKDFQNGALMTTAYGEAFGEETGVIPSIRYSKTFGGTVHGDLFLTRSWIHTRFIDTSSNRYGWDGRIIATGRKGGEIEDYKTNQDMRATYTLGRAYLTWQVDDGQSIDLNYNYIREERKGSNPTGPKNSFTDVDPLSVPAEYTRNILGSSYTTEFPELGIVNSIALKYFAYDGQGSDNGVYSGYDTLPTHHKGGNGGIAEAIRFSSGPLLLRASYEYANRLPERDELFGDGLLVLSNYSLVPEHSHNINIGGRYTGGIGESSGYLVETNLFYRSTKDLISIAPQGPFQVYGNLSEAHILGAELDLSLNLFGPFTLGANGTYQDLRRVNITDPNERYLEGSRLPNIPYFFYNLNARFARKNMLIEGSSFEAYWYYSYVHEFYLYPISKDLEPESLWDDAKVSTDLVIPTQGVHSAGFSFSLPGDRLSLAFEASNLFDAKTYDNFKIQKPGRTLHLKLRSLFR